MHITSSLANTTRHGTFPRHKYLREQLTFSWKFSVVLVSMSTAVDLCSNTICQKSSTVDFKGPCISGPAFNPGF